MTGPAEGGASLGALAALASSVTWALGAAAYSLLSARYEGYRIHFTRAVVALPTFLLVFWFFEAPGFGGVAQALAQMDGTRVSWLLASILASYAIGDVFFVFSLQRIGISGALALASIYPIWSALAGAVFQGEELRALQVAGLLAVVMGVVGVILLGHRAARAAHGADGRARYAAGVFYGLLTSAFWSLNAFSLARGAPPELSALTGVIRLGSALVLCPLFGWLLFRAPVRFPLLSFPDLRKFGWIIWAESFLGSFFFVYGMSHAPLAVATALSSLAPVIAYTMACALGRERASPARAFAVLLVVLGTWGLLF